MPVIEQKLLDDIFQLTAGKVAESFVERGVVCAFSLPMNISTSKLKILNNSDVLPNFKYFEMKNVLKKNPLKFSFKIHDLDRFKIFDKDFKKSEFEDGEVDFFRSQLILGVINVYA